MNNTSALLIEGGRVLGRTPAQSVVRNLGILEGRFVPTSELPADHRVVSARGRVVAPGLIDMHVHLREPGGEHKETIATGATSAGT